MSRALKETSQFKTDKKHIKRSGRHDWENMRAIVKELMNDRLLDEQHCDHKLSGEYEGARECHVEPDWLLIYDKSGDLKTGKLTLIRTGSHSIANYFDCVCYGGGKSDPGPMLFR